MAYNPTNWVDDTVPDIDASNLNKMEQGIATADANATSAKTEVEGIRTGANGTVYQSAGDAVRGQITNLSQQLNSLEEDVCADFGYKITANISYQSNKCPQRDGTFFTDTGAYQHWFGSGYIEIPEGVKLIDYRGINYSTTITPIAFYDVNKQFISCETRYSGFRVVEDSIAVPNNAKYFYQSLYWEEGSERNSNNYTIYDYGQNYDLDEMKQSVDTIGYDSVTYGASAYTSTDIYMSDGTTKTFSGWYSTDFIKCDNRTSIQYDAYAYYSAGSGTDVAYISFFNENKQFIGCLASSDTTSGEKFGSTDLPEGCAYVRGVMGGGINAFVTLNATGMIVDMQYANPLTNGMKICVVGDSLTQGVDVGSHVIRENYPYFMSRYIGCSIVNYGAAGKTSKTWWDNYKDTYTFDSSMDAVLIMFGTNGGLSVNTLATDVEPYDDWHDYADTSVGDYCKLIEHIMEDTQNHAQIVLLTPPYSTYTAAQEQLCINSNPVVKAIAQRYSLPVIDTLYESNLGKFNGDYFRPHDGCHFNAKGYHRLGTFIGSKLKSFISTFSLNDNYDDETPIS